MIEREDIDRLKDIFVTRQECESDMKSVEDKLSSDNARLAVIEHQLKTITWILTAVGGGIITMIIKMFWGA
jgi:hypothetical protein